MFTKIIGQYKFVAPSQQKGKKYSVYTLDGKYICSFGALGYQHYRDRIGHYKSGDHGDEKRRQNYRSRHSRDNLADKTSPGYFAWTYLW